MEDMRMKTLTARYSVLHMLVDGVCALAMFGRFLSWEDGHLYVLIYNFCAFALQMPIGALLDLLCMRTQKAAGEPDAVAGSSENMTRVSLVVAVAGVLCTITGAVTHPAVLGLGNALFHIGGGVGTIYEDKEKQWKGRGLGVFVAPGALGLYLGTLLAKNEAVTAWLWGAGILMALLCAGMLYRQICDGRQRFGIMRYGGRQERDFTGEGNVAGQDGKRITNSVVQTEVGIGQELGIVGRQLPIQGTVWLVVCCFVVVVLRSYIGIAVAFPWKTTLAAGLLSVVAIVGGKMAGGFCGARYGYLRTAVISLLAAAVCYLFSTVLPMGIAALFLFNMTMPITLYLLICGFPQMPGFAFGCLTFALFLGFLPEYFALPPLMSGAAFGGMALENTVMPSLGSVLSLLLILAAMDGVRRFSAEGRGHGRISD